jgi:hypothetical protein
MAPKKAKAKSVAQPGGGQAPSDDASQAGINQVLFRKLQEDIAKIKEHPLFDGIQEADASGIDSNNREYSSHQAAFSVKDCATALTSQGKYKCGANLFWVNQLWSASPGIPMNPTAVQRLSSYYLDAPGPVPMDLIIAVPHPGFKPHEHKGGMQCVSPDEVRIAYVGAVARAVQDCNEAVAGGLTPAIIETLTEKVKQWRHHALSCTFEFRVLGSEDDIYFAAVNLREKLVTDYSTLAVSAYQRIFQVMSIKARKEEILGPLSAARVVEEFNKHAQLAADSEPVTVDSMNAILAIHQHVLKIPEIVAVIEQCEQRFLLKSPFNSITKLHIIIARNAEGPLVKHTMCVCNVCLHEF